MKKYLVVFNNQAGNSNGKKIAQHFKDVADNATVTLLGTESREAALEEITKQAPANDCLVVIGGDGSINTVFSALAAGKINIQVGIIPAGTVNNFAKALNLPLELDAAIQVILGGYKRSVDLATDGQRAIVSSALIGDFADIANNVKQSEKKRLGLLAFLWHGLKHSFHRPDKYRLTLDDDKKLVLATTLINITLTNSVGGYTNFNPQANSDDGYLHILVLKRFSLLRLPSYIAYLLRGQIIEGRDLLYFKSQEVEISKVSGKAAKVRIDGDEAESLPLKIMLHPRQVSVLVPIRESGHLTSK